MKIESIPYLIFWISPNILRRQQCQYLQLSLARTSAVMGVNQDVVHVTLPGGWLFSLAKPRVSMQDDEQDEGSCRVFPKAISWGHVRLGAVLIPRAGRQHMVQKHVSSWMLETTFCILHNKSSSEQKRYQVRLPRIFFGGIYDVWAMVRIYG